MSETYKDAELDAKAELLKITETDEYKKFESEVRTKLEELMALFDANIDKFGCSLVVGATTASTGNDARHCVAISSSPNRLLLTANALISDKR